MSDLFGEDEHEADVSARMERAKAGMLADAEEDFADAKAELARRKAEIDEIFEDEDAFAVWMNKRELELRANNRRHSQQARNEKAETFFALVGALTVSVFALWLVLEVLERLGLY